MTNYGVLSIAHGTVVAPVSVNSITSSMSSGSRVAFGLNNVGQTVGYCVALKSVFTQFITKLNGKTILKVFFTIMDPVRGFMNLQGTGNRYLPSNLNNVFFIR